MSRGIITPECLEIHQPRVVIVVFIITIIIIIIIIIITVYIYIYNVWNKDRLPG
jgi:hypothetical protein